MTDWKSLDKVLVKIVGGGTPSKSSASYWNGSIPWASVKDFKDDQYYLNTTEDTITEEGLINSTSNLIIAGTPLICTRMAVGRASIAGCQMSINQDVKALFPNTKEVDPGYLVRCLHLMREKLERISVGSTVKGITLTQIKELKIYCPQKSEQKAIAMVLDTVDEAIQSTQAMLNKQDKIKQGLLHDLLTRGVDERGHLRPAPEAAPDLYRKTEIGLIPKDWQKIQIEKVAPLQRGHDITAKDLRKGPYPVVSSGGIIGYHTEATSKGPNVVVGRKGTIGKVHYLENDFWAHDTSLFVTNFNGNEVKYIYYLFNKLDLSRFGTKSGSPSLNRNDVHPIWIGLPKPKEQAKIVYILTASDKDIAFNEDLLKKLNLLRSGLMQDLLTGRKRVTPALMRNVEKLAEAA